MLLFENPRRERFDRIVVQHGYGRLQNDRPRVKMLVYEMNRAPRDLNSVLERLVLCVEPREGGKKRRVNIQDPLRVFPHKARAQQAHEPSQADQLNIVPFELLDQPLVVYFAVESLGWHADRVKASLPGDIESARFGAIRDHHRDLGAKPARGDVIGDRFEIGSAAREQNPQPTHRYSTRGRLGLRGTTLPMTKCGSSKRRRSVSAFAQSFLATTRIIPIPKLNVRRQSSAGILPSRRSNSKTGGAGQEAESITIAASSGRMRGVLSVIPPPVMWAAPFKMPSESSLRIGRR